MRLWVAALILWLAAAGCTRYEYEEDVYLAVDGSGSLRVSGSTGIIERFYEVSAADLTELESYFDRSGLDVSSVRRTARSGRDYVHVQGDFDSWSSICRHPAFVTRDCGLEELDEELALHVRFQPEPGVVPEGVPEDSRLALRFHFPSAVRFHNAADGVERGNILSWERTASEVFSGEGFDVEARFERRSILLTTAVVLGAALALVLLVAAVAVCWMYLVGRRQLAEDARSARVEPNGS